METFKEYLKENQPIVYKTILNSFKNNKTSHAYIISGPKGSCALDLAMFMAQSYVCEDKDENNLACLECENCKKISSNKYADLKIFKGEQLTNDAVLSIQEEFSKSSVEKEGYRIYIVYLIENAPVSSLNKLLKFIEEPENNIKAIFTTNSTTSILPTIVSRCQVIKLKEYTVNELVSYLIENNVSEDDAYLVSRISNNAQTNLDIINSESYIKLKEVLETSLNYLQDKDKMFYVYMQNDIISKNTIERFDLYLDMLEVCFLEALIKKEDPNHESKFFNDQITKLSTTYENIENIILEISNTKISLITQGANKNLVFDKFLINVMR